MPKAGFSEKIFTGQKVDNAKQTYFAQTIFLPKTDKLRSASIGEMSPEKRQYSKFSKTNFFGNCHSFIAIFLVVLLLLPSV